MINGEFRVDTRFFYTSLEYFNAQLIPAYQEPNDSTGLHVEHCVYRTVQKTLAMGKSLRPLLSGFSGTTGEVHVDDSFGALDREFPCWLERQAPQGT